MFSFVSYTVPQFVNNDNNNDECPNVFVNLILLIIKGVVLQKENPRNENKGRKRKKERQFTKKDRN